MMIKKQNINLQGRESAGGLEGIASDAAEALAALVEPPKTEMAETSGAAAVVGAPGVIGDRDDVYKR